MSEPAFAVVGHPNKGKSSLGATLARDMSVDVGPEPGTTRHTREFPMRLTGEPLYTLIDTPGFQRARAALEWMRRAEGDAASRPAVVKRFIETHAGDERFHDECELLRPIVDGAGIIYVVDGASPYGPEYEAEMEILRWTGRPSMAIINPIGAPRFVEPWENALGQFFRVVRVLDVLKAPFLQQIEVLRAFGHLREDWRAPLDRAVEALLAQRRQQQADAARLIAELIEQALTYQETKDLAKDASTREPARALEERYRGRLRQLEREARGEVEAAYGYRQLERQEADFELLESDLLATETWLAFGLKKRDLVALGAAGGALAGGIVDASLLGASFFAGSFIGGVIGGTAGFISADRLTEVKVLEQPLGGIRLRCGPTKNLQFPFVLLGRARLHHGLVAARTHAQRASLVLDSGTPALPLADSTKRRLARLFERLRKTPPSDATHAAAVDELAEEIEQLFEEDAGATGSA
ncbi:MAG: GTPase/DUF3482 domain-containing protein [Opitutales bacterium]